MIERIIDIQMLVDRRIGGLEISGNDNNFVSRVDRRIGGLEICRADRIDDLAVDRRIGGLEMDVILKNHVSLR